MTLILDIEQNLPQPVIYTLDDVFSVPVHRVGNFYDERTGPGCGKTCLWNGGGYYQDAFTCGETYPSGKTFYCSADCHRKVGETNKIFLSYRWKDSHTVDTLTAIARHRGIEVVRDVAEMSFLDAISAFMAAAGESRYFVALMTPDYFYSRHCMYEFRQLVDSEAPIRTIPILLHDAASPENEQAYCRHWQTIHSNLTRALVGVERRHRSYLDKELDLLHGIPPTITRFLAEVRERRLPEGDWWLQDHCRYLMGAIKTTFSPTDADAGDWTYSNVRLPADLGDESPRGRTWTPEPFFLHASSVEQANSLLAIRRARELVRATYHEGDAGRRFESGVHVLLIDESFLTSQSLCVRLIHLCGRPDVTLVPVFIDEALKRPASEAGIVQHWSRRLKEAAADAPSAEAIDNLLTSLGPLIERLRDTLVQDIAARLADEGSYRERTG